MTSSTDSPLVYTGGELETHAYLIPGKEGYLCFDAPPGLAEEASRRGWKIEALLITHGHFDHVWDAGLVERDHGCPVYVHRFDQPLMQSIDYLDLFGIPARFPLVKTLSELPVPAQGSLPAWSIGERTFDLFHIPGHSLGSVAFYEKANDRIFGGDILFAGGVGRWDLPGGSRDTLIEGIQRQLLPLPALTEVYPGHGPSTTIGAEKKSNPYL